jgi:hypothetical protein
MPIDIWGIESQLYPMLDAEWMRSGNRIDLKSVSLGDDYTLSFKAQTYTKDPISMLDCIGSKDIGFNLNVCKAGSPIFRVDNRHGFLHLHLKSGNTPFDDHQKLPEQVSLSGCVSQSFEFLRDTVKWKYPTTEIIDSEGFVGSK